MPRYLALWFMATAFILLVVAVINLVVDPYGIFRLIDTPAFNSVKPAAPSRGPMAKAYQVLRVRPKTLILGNSRAELGLDPNHPAWPQTARPVYNAALPGTGTATSLRYLQHVLAANVETQTAMPTLVLWGVDFMDFLTDPTKPTPLRVANVKNAEGLRLMSASSTDRVRQQVRDYAESTLTLAALIDSMQTLVSQRNPYAVDLTSQGFNPMHDYLKITADEGYGAVFKQKDLQYDKSFARLPKSIFDASGNTSSHWQDLQDTLRLCRQHGIELHLFTYPYHVHMHETFRKTGHAAGLSLWKHTLAKMLNDEAAASGHPAFVLWDFSNLNDITTEAVPSESDRQTTMRWYWEAGHFKSKLGGAMLEQMLGTQPQWPKSHAAPVW